MLFPPSSSAGVPAEATRNTSFVVTTPCPNGTFHVGGVVPPGYLNCTPCPHGWTTTNVGSTLAADCDQLLPGFYGTDVAIAAMPCPEHMYRAGGGVALSCTACPAGTTTRYNTMASEGSAVGAKSTSECGECHSTTFPTLL